MDKKNFWYASEENHVNICAGSNFEHFAQHNDRQLFSVDKNISTINRFELFAEVIYFNKFMFRQTKAVQVHICPRGADIIESRGPPHSAHR